MNAVKKPQTTSNRSKSERRVRSERTTRKGRAKGHAKKIAYAPTLDGPPKGAGDGNGVTSN